MMDPGIFGIYLLQFFKETMKMDITHSSQLDPLCLTFMLITTHFLQQADWPFRRALTCRVWLPGIALSPIWSNVIVNAMYQIIILEWLRAFLQSSIRTSPLLMHRHTEGLILIPRSRESWRHRVLRWGYTIISPWDLQPCAQFRAVTRRVPSSILCVCVCESENGCGIHNYHQTQCHRLYSHPGLCLVLTGYWMVYLRSQDSSANIHCELKPSDSPNL